MTGSQGSADYPYANLNPGFGGQGTSGLTDPPTPGPGTVDCQGQITTTLNWFSPTNQPRPSVLLVKRTGSASWAGDSGSAANGLGHPESGTQYAKQSSGSTWVAIENPPATLQLNVSPTAGAVQAEGGPSGAISASAGVSIRDEPHSAGIAFTGTTIVDEAHCLIIGQRLVATVTLPSELDLPDNTYTWTVSGGNPFLEYQATTHNATLVPLPAPSTGKSLTCYFAVPDDQVEIVCNVTVPAFGLSFAVPTEVKVVAPTFSTGALPNSQQSDIGRFTLLPTIDEPDFFALSINGTGVGMYFWSRVIDGHGVGAELGKWNVVQLVTAKIRVHDTTGAWLKNFRWNQQGLDLQFPYITTDYDADGQLRPFADTPRVPTTVTSLGTLHILDDIYIEDAFTFYPIYRPPGEHSTWVPLRKYAWQCRGRAQAGTPWVYLDRPFGSFTPTGNSIPSHPTWTFRWVWDDETGDYFVAGDPPSP